MIDKKNIDFSGEDLSKKNLSGCDFRGSCFDRCDLTGSLVENSDFRGCTFEAAIIPEDLRLKILSQNEKFRDKETEKNKIVFGEERKKEASLFHGVKILGDFKGNFSENPRGTRYMVFRTVGPPGGRKAQIISINDISTVKETILKYLATKKKVSFSKEGNFWFVSGKKFITPEQALKFLDKN